MSAKIIIGAQWGDEGKGKIIDILASEADLVVRPQGGSNAGHTVVVDGQTYKLHLMPSGILYPDTDCVIGNGVVVDPKILLHEMDELSARGIALDRLRIDARAHVVMPYHKVIDELLERARGKAEIGTTRRGIGPCYVDKAERSGIRMCDLIDPPIFEQKLRQNAAFKNELIQKVYGGDPLSIEDMIDEYTQYARRLRPYVCDTTVQVYDAICAGKNVIFEGAQGVLLDLDVGTYPYVTSSHPVSAGACVGAGIGPTLIDECLGIAKAYTTRVGKGPFPTELTDNLGERMLHAGQEFGTTTGRARRCGWLDAVMLRFAVRVNSLTSLAINKLDILRGFETIKICVAYERNGQIVRDFPASLTELADCTPIYKEYPGFYEDIGRITSYDQLPENAKKYIEEIESACGCRVSMVGVGPARAQNILKP